MLFWLTGSVQKAPAASLAASISISCMFLRWKHPVIKWQYLQIKEKLDKKCCVLPRPPHHIRRASPGFVQSSTTTSHLTRQLCFTRWFDFAATFPLEDLMQTHRPSWNPLGPWPSHLGLKHNTSSISWYRRPPTDRKLTGNHWVFFTLLLERHRPF